MSSTCHSASMRGLGYASARPTAPSRNHSCDTVQPDVLGSWRLFHHPPVCMLPSNAASTRLKTRTLASRIACASLCMVAVHRAHAGHCAVLRCLHGCWSLRICQPSSPGGPTGSNSRFLAEAMAEPILAMICLGCSGGSLQCCAEQQRGLVATGGGGRARSPWGTPPG